MPKELFWLTLTVAMTGLLWIPYILDRFATQGIMPTLDNPRANAPPQSNWARRLMAAHYNALENLAIFAPLVLTVHVLNAYSGATAFACALYFWSRLAHAIIYTAGFPIARTLAFAGGVVAQVILVLEIFNWI